MEKKWNEVEKHSSRNISPKHTLVQIKEQHYGSYIEKFSWLKYFRNFPKMRKFFSQNVFNRNQVRTVAVKIFFTSLITWNFFTRNISNVKISQSTVQYLQVSTFPHLLVHVHGATMRLFTWDSLVIITHEPNICPLTQVNISLSNSFVFMTV